MTPQDDDTPGPAAAAGADTTHAGDASAETGATSADAGNTNADAGDTNADAGDTNADAGDASADAGDKNPDAGDTSAGSTAAADTSAVTAGSELRITVARSGGVAGLGPHWAVTVSEEADVDSWLSLVESCPWDAPDPADGDGDGASGAHDGAPDGPIGGSVDRFVYTIRVFLPSDEERDARVPEQRLDGPWRDLVDRVKDAGRPEPRARG